MHSSVIIVAIGSSPLPALASVARKAAQHTGAIFQGQRSESARDSVAARRPLRAWNLLDPTFPSPIVTPLFSALLAAPETV
jgi:hypothetical protein